MAFVTNRSPPVTGASADAELAMGTPLAIDVARDSMVWRRAFTFSTASVNAIVRAVGAWLVLTSCSPATTPPAAIVTANPPSPGVTRSKPTTPQRPPASVARSKPPDTPVPPPLAGEIGRQVPTSFIAASPSGHWTVACEAREDTDNSGNLLVQVSQHGELTGDRLQHVLYVGTASQVVDEFVGSDPKGRFVAVVKDRKLQLLDTATNGTVTLEHADTRATEASFQPLRSISFSDDGQWFAYATGDNSITLRNLTTQKEAAYTLVEPKLYRLRFAPGSRFLLLEVIATDTSKNGKLQWLTPQRADLAPCPSPIPTYNVWQFPGDTPQTRLLDVKTGNLIAPSGFALAAGNVYVERREDQGLLVNEPSKPVRQVSTAECMGRVMHVDLPTGNIVVGCASAWGQRRQIFLRTQDARVALDFDLAAYELDTRLDTTQPNIAFYPGNQTLVFNVRTRERWPLVDGTQVLAISGTTALIEQSQRLGVVKLNPDGTHTQVTTPVARPPFASVLMQGPWVSVGHQVFNLEHASHDGEFSFTTSPLALSNSGQGLFPTRPATPTTLGTGPLRFVNATKVK